MACSHSDRKARGSPMHSLIYITVASHLLTSHCQKQVIWGSHMLSVTGWDSCPSTVGRYRNAPWQSVLMWSTDEKSGPNDALCHRDCAFIFQSSQDMAIQHIALSLTYNKLCIFHVIILMSLTYVFYIPMKSPPQSR